MPRFSKSQIDKLGEQLRKQDVPDERSIQLLQQVRAEYIAPMAQVESVLRNELGLHPTSRIKTINTIIEKLKREKTRLSRMQDIAGLRVSAVTNLIEQDEVVARIRRIFTDSRVVDRREAPSHGYRAVHVIVPIDELSVEIQVRTRDQDLWAQSFERLADFIGRDVRYGGRPERPDTVFGGHSATEVLELLEMLSPLIASVERTVLELREVERGDAQPLGRLVLFKRPDLLRERAELRARVAEIHEELRLILENLP